MKEEDFPEAEGRDQTPIPRMSEPSWIKPSWITQTDPDSGIDETIRFSLDEIRMV